jgi:aminopeptidase N
LCSPPARAQDDGVDFLAFETTIAPDFAGKSVSGQTRITLRATRNAVAQFAVTANALTLDDIKGATRRAGVDKGQWTFDLTRPLRRSATTTVTVTFSGKPARGMTFDNGMVYTSYFACDWMICPQDRPGDKARFTLILDLPPGMTSLGPGTMTRPPSPAPGRERHLWREPRPYPTFVYGFAAGRFTSAFLASPGPTLAVLAEPGVADSDRIQAMFGTTGRMLSFFEDKAGVPFPHARYTQILVKGLAGSRGLAFFNHLHTDDRADPQQRPGRLGRRT